MLPLIALAIASAIGGGASAVGNNMTSRSNLSKQLQNQLDLAKMDDATKRAIGANQLSFDESTQDPFRAQMHQAKDIGALDLMAGSSYSPSSMDFSGSGYGGYVPQRSGGYSFTPSGDAQRSAAVLKRSVMSGDVQPTDTRGGLNILQLLAGARDPNADPNAQPSWVSSPTRGSDLLPPPTAPALTALQRKKQDLQDLYGA